MHTSAIYERSAAVQPVSIKRVKLEEEQIKLDKARDGFQMGLEFFGDDAEQMEKVEAVLSAFTNMIRD